MLNLHRTMTALRDKKKSDEGFTLIELLVVVLIIGVLAAIAIPIFLTQQTQAAEAGIKADLANAKIAYVSSVVSGVVPPTGAVGTGATDPLPKNGFTGSTALTIGAGNTATSFCIADTGSKFHVTASGGVIAGGC